MSPEAQSEVCTSSIDACKEEQTSAQEVGAELSKQDQAAQEVLGNNWHNKGYLQGILNAYNNPARLGGKKPGDTPLVQQFNNALRITDKSGSAFLGAVRARVATM